MLDGYKTWYAGCDYVRFTYKPVENNTDVRRVLRQALLDAMVSEEGEIPELSPWSWLGYYGEGCSHGAYGQSYQGSLLQASGAAAQSLCKVYGRFDAVPRCDMQFTVVYGEDRPDTARHVADASNLAARGQGARGWACRHIDGYGKGDTAYLGSRTSETFVRVYDKSREAGIEKDGWHEWRFECEFKGKQAVSIMSEYLESGATMEAAASIVCRTLERRGVTLPLPEGVRATEDVRWEVAPSSLERRLAWFRNQVAPSIEKAVAQGATRQMILDALGLS